MPVNQRGKVRVSFGEGLMIYIDPWKLGDVPKADLTLITHYHPDHCFPEDEHCIGSRKGDGKPVTSRDSSCGEE